MKTRNQTGISGPQLLISLLILGFLVVFVIFPFIAVLVNKSKNPQTVIGEMNIRLVSYGIIQYMQDNDQKLPRAGLDCLDHSSDPKIFKRGERNQCGGNDWQDAISPYVKGRSVFVSPADKSDVGGGPWGGGTGTNLKASDGHFSLLYNDLLSHAMPTKSGGYADPAHEDKRANGLKLAEITSPYECILLAEGHGGWDKCSTKTPPLLVATDWTGSTDLQNKWHHDYTISGNYTGFMSIADYSGVVTIQHGLPFYNGGGNVAFVDGHQQFKQYSDPHGSPVLCRTLPWTEAMDPKQRNKDRDSCTDPNNPVAAGWGGSNWF